MYNVQCIIEEVMTAVFFRRYLTRLVNGAVGGCCGELFADTEYRKSGGNCAGAAEHTPGATRTGIFGLLAGAWQDYCLGKVVIILYIIIYYIYYIIYYDIVY